jgi:hypothetical protein
MKRKHVNDKYKVERDPLIKEEEIVSDTEMSDEFDDLLYKRYKIMHYEVKKSIDDMN